LAGDSERGFVVEAVVKRGDVAWLKIMVFSRKKPFGSTPVPVYTPQSPALCVMLCVRVGRVVSRCDL
jgi:hypothetical protein